MVNTCLANMSLWQSPGDGSVVSGFIFYCCDKHYDQERRGKGRVNDWGWRGGALLLRALTALAELQAQSPVPTRWLSL